jgi:hypothetical protein
VTASTTEPRISIPRRPLNDVVESQHGQRHKPDRHHQSEELADAARSTALDREQRHEDAARERQHERRESRTGDGEPLDGAEHRDRRRDHAVAVQQRRADDRQERHAGDPSFARRMRAEPIRNNCQQGEDAPLAMVVGAHDEAQILDGHHHDQRPQHERQNSVQVGGAGLCAPRGEQTFLQGVQRTCADVAKHDSQGAQHQRRHPRRVFAVQRGDSVRGRECRNDCVDF